MGAIPAPRDDSQRPDSTCRHEPASQETPNGSSLRAAFSVRLNACSSRTGRPNGRLSDRLVRLIVRKKGHFRVFENPAEVPDSVAMSAEERRDRDAMDSFVRG